MKVAVVGCGYWGKNLVRNFAQLGALSAVCDATERGRAEATTLAPDAVVVDDVTKVLESDVDGIVIATPAETHYALAKRALETGKDVFVEKPLALTHAQGLSLAHAAEQRQRILMVGHVLEYHPAVVELRRLVNSGELGKIRYLYSNRLSLGKIRHEENVLWSFAPHDISVILRLVGELPVQVTASGGSYISPGIADATVVNLQFSGEIRAHIFVSWLHPFKEQRLVVVGEHKMASFDDVRKELVVYDHKVEVGGGSAPVAVKGEGETRPFSDSEPLRLECQAFLEAMRTRVPPLTHGYSGSQVLQVLEAAQRSLAANGAPTFLSAQPLGMQARGAS